MRKLLYAKDSKEFWQIFSQEREKRRRQLARLPFAKKVAILEKMQADLSDWSGLGHWQQTPPVFGEQVCDIGLRGDR